MKCARRRPVSQSLISLGISFCCLSLAGCLTGAYQARMDETLAQLRADTERAAAVHATFWTVKDSTDTATGITLRLPVFVGNSAKPLARSDAGAQPPFCQIPGLAYAYELPFDGVPAFVYFAAVRADIKDVETLSSEVQTEVAKAFSAAGWQDVSLTTFGGGTVQVRRISCAGPQLFGTQKEEGIFELYLFSSASHHVLLGWRASSPTNAAQGFFDKVAISMSTVQGTAG